MSFAHELVVGETATRTSAVRSVRSVAGGSGALLIVVLEHEYRQRDVLCVREEQTLIYRDPPADPVPLPVDGPSPTVPAGGWTAERRPAPPLLFRFSAITFNSHRIHYDLPYARDVEGYPGLVVHGPLTAISLAQFAAECTGGRLAEFELQGHRADVRRPARDDRVLADGSAQAVRNDGTVAMQATYVVQG